MNISSQFSKPITNHNSINMTLNKKSNINYSTSAEEITNTDKEVRKDAGIWGKISKEYDIRNASFDELCEISTKLYQAGQISLFDHAILTFDPSKSPQPVKPNLCLTEANANGKRDWIAEYKARTTRDLQMGNFTGFRVNKNILGILEHLL